jgi:hypothetical protein
MTLTYPVRCGKWPGSVSSWSGLRTEIPRFGESSSVPGAKAITPHQRRGAALARPDRAVPDHGGVGFDRDLLPPTRLDQGPTSINEH